ncbi:MAG TPA: rhamnogalacturonan acetylesterase [Kineosporiaceae bacterium]|nr:rhamnogalacturonan acetylesterase [Kineosporiaceae bacterium]
MNRLHRSTHRYLGRLRQTLRSGAFLGTALSAALLSAALVGSSVGAGDASAASASKATRFTIYVAGDSTASIYDATLAPRTGWGQALPVFTGPAVTVRDAALSGASSKSFADLGLLDTILSTISPGDYLLISFGHNDEKADEARHTDPYTTYQSYLRRYLDGARQHGAHPVLVTPVERRRFDTAGHALLSHGEYPEAMRQLAAAEGVPLIDLTTSSRARWEALGPEGTQAEFLWLDPAENPNYPDGVQDNTHFQAHGAIEVARLIAQDLCRQRVLPPGSLVALNRTAIPDSAITWPAAVPVG